MFWFLCVKVIRTKYTEIVGQETKKKPSSGVNLEYSLSSAVNSQPDMIVDNDESRLDAEQQKPCFLSFLFLNSAHCSKRSLSQIWILAVVGNSARALGEISLGSGGDKPPPHNLPSSYPPLFSSQRCLFSHFSRGGGDSSPD